MKFLWELVFGLLIYVNLSSAQIPLQAEAYYNMSLWGDDCPDECQCHPMSLSMTLMSRWFTDEGDVKTALCVLQKQSMVEEVLLQLPNDTEVLTLLQASDAPIAIIDATLLEHLQLLRGLDIQGARRHPLRMKLTTKALAPLTSLQYLSLIRVDLSKAHKVFANLKALENLQVTECQLNVVTWNLLQGLNSLKDLYFSHNNIRILEDFAFYGAPQLQRLLLSHNQLFSIHMEAFLGLLKLEMLDLSSNHIDHLSELTFPPMPRLQWLDLRHNPVQVIFPNCFQYLNATEKLSIGHSKEPIHFMKFSFRGLNSLASLHMPNVDIDVLVEHVFFGLYRLQHLVLQGKVLAVSDRAFMGAHFRLREIILRNCKLAKVFENAFLGLSKLTRLDLSKNELRYLPPNVFEPLESLQELNLRQNHFSFLSEPVLQPLHSLQMLRLDSNPWNCTCRMEHWDQSIVAKLHASPPPCIFENFKCADLGVSYITDETVLPRCEYPEQHRGASVLDVTRNLKPCKN